MPDEMLVIGYMVNNGHFYSALSFCAGYQSVKVTLV